MREWLEKYPHRIYASVLILDGKIVDYKIGQDHWEGTFQVTLRGQISFDDLLRSETRYTFWEVHTSEEHENVFNNLAQAWIQKQV